VQFLYCAELEDSTDPTALRAPFWELVTEAERRSLHLASFRTIHHLTHGRDSRLAEFHGRLPAAAAHLSAWPPAEGLGRELARVAELEEAWSKAYTVLERLPRDADDTAVADAFSAALDVLFGLDRELAASRQRFLEGIEDFPALGGQLEAVAASVRRLQRVSERLRMVEDPANFPEQADLAKLRESAASLHALRQQTDALVDSLLGHKPAIDAILAVVVDNFAPERIDPVDRAILRLGTYELLHTPTPPKVVINEAIELARLFGTTDSHRFVNGVLDRIAKQAGAPAPAAAAPPPQPDASAAG